MDPFDEILSDPGFTSRTGGRFQPKIKPRPKKQTLAPQLSTVSQDKKGTTSDAKSCHDGRGNTKSIKSSSQLPVIEENKESEDDLLLATVRSDFIGCSHHTSVESAIMVDSTQLDLDSCGGILPSGSTIDDTSIRYSIDVQDGVTDAIDTTTLSLGPVGVENPTDDSKNSGILNYSHSSASRAHEATVLGQSGLGSIQPEDGHSNDGKIAGQNTDVFDELEWLDDFHNQPKNEADPSSLKQATISNEDGDLDTQRLEVEECEAGANITRDIISSGTTTPSEQPACKYIPKPKMRVAGDSCTQISQPEISNTLPPSPQDISCDTRCMHEASIGTHSDGVLNDSSINFDDYSPVNQHIEAPVNVESLAYDSYGDILVDDFNSDDQDEMLREEGGKNGEEDPLSQSNMSQQQEVFPPVGEEIDHSKTSRKLRQQVSHQPDDPEDGVDDFPSERFSNCDIHGDGHKKNGTSKGRRGTKTKTKSLKPSSDNEKPARKRKEANKAVPDLQAEKRPKKFSHSTRRNRRQVNKVLLETPEDEIDFQKISFRDLIIYHEHKEKLEAVRQFGTDFCMIQQLFPGRTRHQIKLKFKNEERHHPFRLSDAITNRAKDHSQFLSLIGQLQEAANKAKHESNEDELTENSGDEEMGELAPETNVCLLSLALLSLDFFQQDASVIYGAKIYINTDSILEEEVAKPGEVEDTKMEEFVGEIHSPLKADESDDDDPHRWDEYKFDY
ncbi:hypothetical protein SDJN02_21712, partial [Cucurbita argyrosperma subsp. argyrosperma]